MREVERAVSLGLPIITTPVYGIPEQVFDQVNGLYYQPGDIAALQTALARLIADAPLRRQLGENSLQVAQILPNDVEVADAYHQMLHEAALSLR
jgi:glycosyltransferase involved in cell wall biosynthesis